MHLLSATFRSLAIGLFALAMVLCTGCAKEEVLGPNGACEAASNGVKSGGDGPVAPTGASGDGSVNITDDGDDLGDKESTNKPKPH